MTDTSQRPLIDSTAPSPMPRRMPRPGWLDTRLIMGVGLVIVAVVLGATVVSGADHRTPVWVLSRDVAAGTVLKADDLGVARVQLGSAGARYVPSSEAVVGRALTYAMHAGELLPRAELVTPPAGVTVTIPVRAENAPKLDRGVRITVWVSGKFCRGVVVLSGVPVQDVRQSGGSSFGTSNAMGVVVSVPSEDAQRIISALDLDGAVVRVGVLADGEAPAAVGNLLGCATSAQRG